MTEEKFTFFWNGPFSQWEESEFTIDDISYNTAEQYMMAEKARLFGDEDTLEKIMEADDPSTQKALGRLVEDFDDDLWCEDEENGRPRCWNIVWRGNMAKFSQNPHLLKTLLKTEGTTLVEASPQDLRWGIGWRANEAGAKNRETWRGNNWLGEVLTCIRELLKNDPRIYNSLEDSRKPM